MSTRALIGAALGCALVVAGFVYLGVGNVAASSRALIVSASILIATAVVWLVGRDDGPRP